MDIRVPCTILTVFFLSPQIPPEHQLAPNKDIAIINPMPSEPILDHPQEEPLHEGPPKIIGPTVTPTSSNTTTTTTSTTLPPELIGR